MYKNCIKRLMDIILASIFIVIFSPILIMVAIAIKINDGGCILYNANRIKKNGKVFKMYKFRSMKENAPDLRNSDGSTVNSENDIRLTKVGKFIRKSSLDELPQLFNVLKGDMSLVGPRPDLPDALSMYKGNQFNKLLVRPGITGYSQAYFRNAIDMDSKIKNDLYYVENISFLLDIKIIVVTARSILVRSNIYNERSD